MGWRSSMGAASIRIPDDILESLRMPPDEVEDELKKDLAVALYARRALSFGEARRLANLSHRDFRELLAKRKIVRHYDERDLEEDLAHVEGDL